MTTASGLRLAEARADARDPLDVAAPENADAAQDVEQFVGDFEHGDVVRAQRVINGVKLDAFALGGILKACSELEDSEDVRMMLHGCVVKVGLDLDVFVGSAMVDIYAKNGGLEEAIKIEMYRCTGDLKAAKKTFEKITCLDTFSWSQMILSYAVHGHEREAQLLFKKMFDCGVIVNKFAFLAVLIACSHQGLVDEGFRHYESMVSDYGFVPDVNHIACMVDLLGHVGKVADAEDFIIRIHGDKNRGVKIGEKLMMLEPYAASSYVMLYNLYMDAGKISLAMRTRGQMRERGMTKEAGISWAEFGGSIHQFVDGDNSCSQKPETFTRLEELLVRVKQKTEHGGMNVWELGFQARKVGESSISKHGELLAVALGLSTLPNTASVRVMKNQNMSWESHETLKLLSEGENKEIIIRDPARFHHFSQGSCSCRDYCEKQPVVAVHSAEDECAPPEPYCFMINNHRGRCQPLVEAVLQALLQSAGSVDQDRLMLAINSATTREAGTTPNFGLE
ncbi:hypothetical protein C2845_PM01G25780 [Panicum miliaceum]|uniref:DYW domain-containing protein n=1 Tax=Panicum miliaceum TaxID=4540 RepID=A0A3L6TT23_PANMI|nr:hypothetical protein C2845_PM01G25780 [Panicum miliaceum]